MGLGKHLIELKPKKVKILDFVDNRQNLRGATYQRYFYENSDVGEVVELKDYN